MSTGNEIVVGVSLPFTGRYERSAGVYYSRAYGLWEREVNASGGLLGRQVRLLTYDDASEPDNVAANYRRLVHEDRVDLLLGPCHSVLVEAAAPIVEEAGKLLIQGSGSSHEIFEKGRRYLFLCWSGSDFDYPKSFLEYMTGPESPSPVRRIGLAYTDGRIGSAVALGVKHYSTEFGVELARVETIGPAPVDYPAMYRRLKDANPDAVLIGLDHTRPDKPMHESVAAAIEAGFEPTQLWLSDNPSPRDLEAGPGIDGAYMRGSWVWSDRSPLSVEFARQFEEAFDSRPEYHSAGGYACCQVLTQAVEAAGTCDDEPVREKLLSMTFDSVMGPLRFTETGLPDAKIQLCQWQGGELQIVYPEAARTAAARA